MAFDRWKQRSWVGTALAVALRSLLSACLLDKQFASLPGNNLGSSGTRKAPGLFRLFHKQHVWLVHTNCSCPFFLLGIGSQGNEHVPTGQRSEPEHRIGNPPCDGTSSFGLFPPPRCRSVQGRRSPSV